MAFPSFLDEIDRLFDQLVHDPWRRPARRIGVRPPAPGGRAASVKDLGDHAASAARRARRLPDRARGRASAGERQPQAHGGGHARRGRRAGPSGAADAALVPHSGGGGGAGHRGVLRGGRPARPRQAVERVRTESHGGGGKRRSPAGGGGDGAALRGSRLPGECREPRLRNHGRGDDRRRLVRVRSAPWRPWRWGCGCATRGSTSTCAASRRTHRQQELARSAAPLHGRPADARRPGAGAELPEPRSAACHLPAGGAGERACARTCASWSRSAARLLPETFRKETFEEEKERSVGAVRRAGREGGTASWPSRPSAHGFVIQAAPSGEIGFIPVKDGRPMEPAELAGAHRRGEGRPAASASASWHARSRR